MSKKKVLGKRWIAGACALLLSITALIGSAPIHTQAAGNNETPIIPINPTPTPTPTPTPDPTPTPTPDPTPTPTPVEYYDDVPKGEWYYGSVMYMKEEEYMFGITKETFEPNSNIIRADIASLIYRIEGKPDVTFDDIFPDVSDGYYFSKPIIWASNEKIVAGYDDGKFHLYDNITRQDMVSMMYRYAGKPEDKATGDITGFADYDKVYDYAKVALQWAVAEGILSGKEGNLIDPQGTATRAECAAILYRYLT